MDELDKIKSDIIEIKLELKPLEKLPDKLDELIKSQQEFILLLSQKYTSDKTCSERRIESDKRVAEVDKKIVTLDGKVDRIFWTTLSAAGALLMFMLNQMVLHK